MGGPGHRRAGDNRVDGGHCAVGGQSGNPVPAASDRRALTGVPTLVGREFGPLVEIPSGVAGEQRVVAGDGRLDALHQVGDAGEGDQVLGPSDERRRRRVRHGVGERERLPLLRAVDPTSGVVLQVAIVEIRANRMLRYRFTVYPTREAPRTAAWHLERARLPKLVDARPARWPRSRSSTDRSPRPSRRTRPTCS